MDPLNKESPMEIEEGNGDAGGNNAPETGNDVLVWHPKWNENQRNDLLNHLNYHAKCYEIGCELITNGSTSQPEPKKPKSKLTDCNSSVPKASTKLTGSDLHNYLVKKLILQNESSSVEMPDVTLIINNNNTSLNEFKNHLIQGLKYVTSKENILFRAYLDLGKWLTAAYTKFDNDKKNKLIEGTWENWLDTHVGISASYSRKLRQMSDILGKYPMFYNLSTTFNDIFEKINEIKDMLNDQNYANYWSGQQNNVNN